MKNACVAAVLAFLIGCGDDEPKSTAKVNPPPPTAIPKAPPPEPPKPPPPPPAPSPSLNEPRKATGDVGKSAIAPVWACPEPGCKYTEAKKNTCLTHPQTTLKEQWFVCAKDSVNEPVPGKCSKCGAELSKTLK